MSWYDERISDLQGISRGELGFDIDESCIERGRLIAETWEQVTGRRPFVSVIYDGELQIEDEHEGRYLEVEIRSDGLNCWFSAAPVRLVPV